MIPAERLEKIRQRYKTQYPARLLWHWQEIQRLKSELAQARAAAVQWVTYDGTPETLPERCRCLLFRPHNFIKGGFSLKTHYSPDEFIVGDRWAYLPTPPEATNEAL